MVTGMACVGVSWTQTAPGQFWGVSSSGGWARLAELGIQSSRLVRVPTSQAFRAGTPQEQHFRRQQLPGGHLAFRNLARALGTRLPFAPKNARGGV
jgi:hypothetical protein